VSAHIQSQVEADSPEDGAAVEWGDIVPGALVTGRVSDRARSASALLLVVTALLTLTLQTASHRRILHHPNLIKPLTRQPPTPNPQPPTPNPNPHPRSPPTASSPLA